MEKSSLNGFPKISIVTPSFNQGKFLEKTILSVLEQGYPNLEYIIVDGGSSDESVEIIKKYADRLNYWVSEPDRGQSHAINKGFERATGEIFGWLNSDDWYHPGALLAVVEAFAANPDAGAVVGAGEMVDEAGIELFRCEPFPVTVETLYNWQEQFFWQPSCFFSKKAWAECGPLDEEIHYAMDLDLWFNMAKNFSFALTPADLSCSLKHAQAKTSVDSYLTVMDAAIVIIRHGGEKYVRSSLQKYAAYLFDKEQGSAWQLQNTIDTNEFKIQQAANHISQLESHARLLDDRISQLLNSFSWKITSPLRSVEEWVKKTMLK
jgi:glycosyltransferase involved in cell wall biosynthesis